MKKLLFILILPALLFTQSCIDDCGECFTPPASFGFAIVDKDTGEDVFFDETFETSAITVVNKADESDYQFNLRPFYNYKVIEIYSIGWVTETVDISIRVNGVEAFNLVVDAERVTENCCTFTKYNDLQIVGPDFEFDTDKRIYKILVDSDLLMQ